MNSGCKLGASVHPLFITQVAFECGEVPSEIIV